MRCENCKHLIITLEQLQCQTGATASCKKSNGRYLYSATPCYASISDIENNKPLYTSLECLAQQLKNQKQAPKWCPLKEEK